MPEPGMGSGGARSGSGMGGGGRQDRDEPQGGMGGGLLSDRAPSKIDVNRLFKQSPIPTTSRVKIEAGRPISNPVAPLSSVRKEVESIKTDRRIGMDIAMNSLRQKQMDMKQLRAQLGAYPTGDPLLELGLKTFGPNVVNVVTADELKGYQGWGKKQIKAEALSGLTPEGEFMDNPYININRGGAGTPQDPILFDQSPEEGTGTQAFRNYEGYPMALAHEYRHPAISRIRQTQKKTLRDKIDSTLRSFMGGSKKYRTDIDREMDKVFKPDYKGTGGYDWSFGLLPRAYPGGALLDSEEIAVRYVDLKYGKSPALANELKTHLERAFKAGQWGISSQEDIQDLITNIEKLAEGVLGE